MYVYTNKKRTEQQRWRWSCRACRPQAAHSAMVIHPLLASSRGLYAHAHTRAQRASIRVECTRGRAAAGRQRFSCKFPPRGLIVISNLSSHSGLPPFPPPLVARHKVIHNDPYRTVYLPAPVVDRTRRTAHIPFGRSSSYNILYCVCALSGGGRVMGGGGVRRSLFFFIIIFVYV